MDPSHERVISEDKIRYTVLRKLYEKAGPKDYVIIPYRDVFTEEELNENQVHSIVKYLENEGLIKVNWNGGDAPVLSITHKGIKEVEQSIKQPDKPTEHFQTGVIQNFYGIVGAVQTGNNNTANVTQNNSLDISEALKLIQEIRQNAISLPQEIKEEAIEQLEDIEAEIQLPNPKPSRIKATMQALLNLASGTATTIGFADAVHSLSEWLPGFIQSLSKISGS
jgi:DNA-binding PadR family transcriptional regulator